jgi:hypothetical protein
MTTNEGPQAIRETITVTIKLHHFDTPRTVQAETITWQSEDKAYDPDRAFVHGVVGIIGRGVARYPTTLILNRVREGDKPRQRTTKVTDTEGRNWDFHLGTCIRNRQALIVGWTDEVGATNHNDQERVS